MKTVCLDLRALQIGHQNRGIGMYIRSVLEHLPNDDTHYILYCFDKSNPIETLGIKTRIKYTIVSTPTVNTVLDSPKNVYGIFKLVGHRFNPLRKYNPDSFVQFDFTLGVPKWRGVKKIVVGYDLIPLLMKNEYMPSVTYAWYHTHGKKAKIKAILRSIYYRFRYSIHYRIYQHADKVLCISESTASSFKHLLRIDSKKIATIPLAPVVSTGPADTRIADSIKKPYVFYIGGTDSRKKIQDIIYAFNIARGRGHDLSLVLAGNEFRELEHIPDVLGRNAIMRSPYRHDIHLVGFVTDEEKLGLYESALAFTFTTTYEGFGLPIIEAMAASCPVVSYDNSSIPEAAGDAAILVKTGDFVTIANQLAILNQNKDIRRSLVRKGHTQAKNFSWESYTASFLELLA